jgi:SAM-dependent methyltransferase
MGAGLHCEAEGRSFAATLGVYRLLDEKRRTELRPYLELEHRRRRDLGFEATPGLPEPPAGHRLSALWRSRARRLREGLRLTQAVLGPGPWRVLEVGAGCAWAGAVLAAAGHRVTAIDASLDPRDGLLAAERLRARGVLLELAEADLEALPLEAGRFDLVLAVDALHYARQIQRALVELRRVTRREGALLVLESPVYARREDGEADVARLLRRLQRVYHVEPPRETQAGYLVRGELPALFGQAGYRLEKGAPPFAGWARLADLVAVLLGRGGMPARPVLLARRDG